MGRPCKNVRGRDAFLAALPCMAAQSFVHVYVDQLRAGIDAPMMNPARAAHFVNCRPCSQILQGLVAAVEAHDVAHRDL